MNKKDLEHTVKNLHLSPEAKNRIAHYLDSVPRGEEVFHTEPVQHTSFLHHAGIGIAACMALAAGIGGIWTFNSAVPAPSSMESATNSTEAFSYSKMAFSIPDFSDTPTYYTYISGTDVFLNEYQPDAFAFSLTSEEQKTLSAVINTCTWHELSDTPLFEGTDCLMLDFENSVLEIWLNPSTENQTFEVRYTADKTTGEQVWYEADIQVYQDIMEVVSRYITDQLNSGIIDCIPTDLYNADLRFSLVDSTNEEDYFYLIDDNGFELLAYAFDNVKWGYDLHRENTDVNAWQTDTFLPAASPSYCLYIRSSDNELYRCTVWLDTNGSDQIEFLHYTDGRLVGSRYSIEFDSDMKEALTVCAESTVTGGYVPDKPDEFYTLTIWNDQLLPLSELDFSRYEKLLAEFNNANETILEMPFGDEVDEVTLRSFSIMPPEVFLALLGDQIGVSEGNGVVSDGEAQAVETEITENLENIRFADMFRKSDTITWNYSNYDEDENQFHEMNDKQKEAVSELFNSTRLYSFDSIDSLGTEYDTLTLTNQDGDTFRCYWYYKNKELTDIILEYTCEDSDGIPVDTLYIVTDNEFAYEMISILEENT